jgi:hypothetical protein
VAPCFKDALSKLLFCIAFRDQISAINLMIHALAASNPIVPAAALDGCQDVRNL